MTTTPLRPSTTWAELDNVPMGLKADVSARIARQLFRAAVRRLPVTVREGSASTRTWGTGGPEMRIQRPAEFFARLGRDGLIGFGEAYLTGAWDAEDLGGFLTVLAADLPTLVPAPLQKLRAAYVRRPPKEQKNSTDNTRDNIAHHYDLSNDLFKLFLDETMSYSSALYDTSVTDRGDHLQAAPPEGQHGESLDEAQARKIERLLDQAGVGQGTRVLEIGTGWGELAIRAARRGATVHSVTLSSEQLELARELVAEAGYADQVEPRAQRLPRRAGSVRRHRLGGDDRGRRARVLVDVLRDHRPPARPRRQGRHPGDHDAARPDARDPADVDVDQQVHLPRRLPALGQPRSTRSPARTPPCGSRSDCPSGSTTPRRSSAGTVPSGRPASRSASSASTAPSSECGTSTWSTPAPASPRATSTCSSSPSRGVAADDHHRLATRPGSCVAVRSRTAARDRAATLRRRRAPRAAACLGRLRGRPGRRPARGAALA